MNTPDPPLVTRAEQFEQWMTHWNVENTTLGNPTADPKSPVYQAFRSCWDAAQDAGRERLAEVEADRDALRAKLAEAAEDIEGWGAYASEFWQEKHGLAKTVEEYRRAALGTAPEEGDQNA